MQRFRSTAPGVEEFCEFERNNVVVGPPLYFVVTGSLDFSDEYNRRLVAGTGAASIYNYIVHASEFANRSYIMMNDLSSWSDDFDNWLNTVGCCRIKSTDFKFCQPSDDGEIWQYLFVFD